MSNSGYLSRRALWLHKLSDEVMNGLILRIKSGGLPPGAPLPRQDELMAEFVTSDGVVDRALERLLAEGVIRKQAGWYVAAAARPSDVPFDVPEPDDATVADVRAILELRIGLECEAAALAAQRRTADQLAEVKSAEAALEKSAGPSAAQADFRFHTAISAASGNPYILDLVAYLGPLFIPRMRLPISAREDSDGDLHLENAVKEHRAIVTAIEDGDKDAARQAMCAHLRRTLELLDEL